MKRRRKVNRPMLAAGIMLCLVLLSACLGSGIYARYTVKATAGDKGRVAKFEVDIAFVETAQAEPEEPGNRGGETAAAKPGELTADNNNAQLTISNNSEVAVRVKLRIEFASATKDYLKSASLKKVVTGTETAQTITPNFETAWSSDGKTLDFGKVVDLAPGASISYDMTLEQDPAANPSEKVGDSWKSFSNADTDSESGTINYVIIAGYTQID